MKKSITYSVALVGTALLSSSWALGEGIQPLTHAVTDNGQDTKDSFLSKLGDSSVLQLAQASHPTVRTTRACGAPDGTVHASAVPTDKPVDNNTTAASSQTDNNNGTTSGSGGTIINKSNILQFGGVQARYREGDFINIVSQITTARDASSQERFDLWVAMYIMGTPPDQLFFFNGSPTNPTFSLQPQPFQRSLERVDSNHSIIETFKVTPDIQGEYVLFALLVAEGQNPLESESVWRSNLAKQSIILDK